MDYKELLAKYIAHIHDSEGFDYFDGSVFDEAEMTALRELIDPNGVED